MRFALSPTPNHRSLAVVLAAASASALSFALVSAVFKPRKRIGKRGEGGDIELITKQTERNQRILASATDLISEPWGFDNCHFASLLAQVRPSPFWGDWGKRVTRRIETIRTPAGCDVEVEFVEPKGLDSQTASSVPTVIILHGINGHCTEPYVEQAALHIAVEKGWRCIVLNYAKAIIYGENEKKNALGGQTLTDAGDLNFLISHIRKNHDGFLAAIGFSMGGAKLVQYLSRTREHCNLDAACSISSPLDFTARNKTVHRPDALIQRMYHFVVTSSVKLSLAMNYAELKKHPMLSQSKPFRRTPSGLLWWLTSNKVTDIDDAITLPTKGYANLDQYYRSATHVDNLGDNIKTPFLILTAKNDAFVPEEIVPGLDIANENENIFIANTLRVGGHIGFWLPGRGCWATKACLSFFDSVRLHTTSKPRPKTFRRASSLRAAHYLQRTSSTGLTNYAKLVAHDSDYSFAFDEDAELATMSNSESYVARISSQSMLNHFTMDQTGGLQVASNPLLTSVSSFVF